jgi:hypothetical protein
VEENPRRYLRHLTQNRCRGEWASHYTAQKLALTQTTTPIDWPILKKTIHQDGNMMSGFSTKKTSHIRGYVTKLVTGTLPTMKILHDKWTLYDTDVCPRCFEEPETNQHIWTCSKATESMDRIAKELESKYRLPTSLRNETKLMIQGIPTMAFTHQVRTKINRHLELTTGNKPTSKETTRELEKLAANLTRKGHDEIWRKRCEDSANYQQTILGIQTRQKNNKTNERRQPSQNDTNSTADARPDTSPRVIIGWNDLEKRKDAYRCECGKHSLTHTPGRHCDKTGLILNRAQDVITSSRNRLIKTIPFFLENKVLSWTAPRQ